MKARIVALRIASILSALCLVWPAYAQGADPAPYEIMRSLQSLQNNILLDTAKSQSQQAKMMQQLADAMRAAPAETWRDPRNRSALIAYVLSGGSAGIAKPIGAGASLTPEEQIIFNGAIAAAEGHDGDALHLLETVDARKASSEIGGLIALTQARLARGSDTAKALQYLDVARLIAPGALVEEAALRQQVFLVSDDADPSRFVALSQRYISRFSQSNFYGNFLTRFKSVFVRTWVSADDANRAKLEITLVDLPRNERNRLLLTLARETLARGDNQGARRAAAQARAAIDLNDALAPRVELYEAAASLFSGSYETARARLEKIDAAKLPPEERALRAGALALAARAQAPKDGVAAAPDGPATNAMNQANAQIAIVDALLGDNP